MFCFLLNETDRKRPVNFVERATVTGMFLFIFRNVRIGLTERDKRPKLSSIRRV